MRGIRSLTSSSLVWNLMSFNVKTKRLKLERVSIEYRKTKTKTKTKVITSANQKGLIQSGKPIKTRSNYT